MGFNSGFKGLIGFEPKFSAYELLYLIGACCKYHKIR